MNADALLALEQMFTAAIAASTANVRATFQEEISSVTNRLQALETPIPIVAYEPVVIVPGVACEEPLDIIKSLPEFDGDCAKYVSWRQAVFAAHVLFDAYRGSTRYYQAVAIIRNKVVGAANLVLSSFNTVLNFNAIIARLDFTYSDKRPIYILEQEMSMLRQGSWSLMKFYDEVEKKSSLIINKVIMTNNNNRELSAALCQKYRDDALRIFVSGLRKPMSDVLFSSRPADLPSALALAQELESNQARFNFGPVNSNPVFPRNNFNRYNVPNASGRRVEPNLPNSSMNRREEPMEVDPTQSRLRQDRSFRRGIQPQPERVSNQRFRGNSQNNVVAQGINHLEGDDQLAVTNSSYVGGDQQDDDNGCGHLPSDFSNASLETESVNFFGISPSYPMWEGR